MPTVSTSPWQAAVDRLAAKTTIGSRLRSAEWAGMPLALREGAQFSAGVEEVRVLSAIKEHLSRAAQQIRTEGTLTDRSRFVAEMRSMLGAAPGDSGDLRDITSRRRLELIWNFQQQDAHAYAAREASLDPDALDAYPAQRLVRIESRRVPRDWFARWGAAGASVGWQGASRSSMVALITSPIWSAISRFGKPHPPFDYGSGMGLEAVDRDEAETLGLLPKNDPPAERLQRLRGDAAAARRRWTDGLQASTRGLSAEAISWLKGAFGDQVVVEGDTVRWQGSAAPAPAPAVPATDAPAVSPPLPDIQLVTTAVAKAKTREEAHAVIALPQAARGSLSLNPTAGAKAQTETAHDFLRTVLHRDVAPTASAKVSLTHGGVGRGYYDPSTATAYVRTGAVINTVHELAHHIECSDPEVFAECRAFLQSRTKANETPQPLSKITGWHGYGPHEIAIEDEWATRGGSAYSGRVYPAQLGATEVLTMGLERLYSDPVKFAHDDPDYFQFVLKVLRPTPSP